MGVTVRQKRKGRNQPWHVFIHQGKTIVSRSVGTKQEAGAVAVELRRKLRAGKFGLPTPEPKSTCPTFEEYARRYLETYAKTMLKWTTRTGYESVYRLHVPQEWKTRRLDQITRADLKTFLAGKCAALSQRGRPMSPGTVRNIRTFISGVFTQAVEDGLLAVNPAQQLGRFLPRCPDRKAHIRALTREQVKAVLDAAAELYPDYYPLVLCGFRTGMRMGELLGLAWEDVDFEGKCINLRRSWSHNRFSTPKTHKGRVVDLSDQLARVLLAHRQALLLKFKGKLRAVPVPAGMAEGESINVVFPYFTGRQIDPSWFRRVAWRRLFEKANVPQVRIHDMRHTFASLLLQQGESLHYVKEQLGHSSIQTTVDVYGHLAPGSNRNAVNKLDDPVAPLRVAAAG